MAGNNLFFMSLQLEWDNRGSSLAVCVVPEDTSWQTRTSEMILSSRASLYLASHLSVIQPELLCTIWLASTDEQDTASPLKA